MEVWEALIGPLGFAAKSLRRRGFHSYLAFLGLTLTVATTTFMLLIGQDLATRLGIDSSMRSTFGMSWLIFAYLVLRSEEHTSELQSQSNLVCRLLLVQKNAQLVDQ